MTDSSMKNRSRNLSNKPMRTAVSLLSGLLVLASTCQVLASGGPLIAPGWVEARTVILGEHSKPVFVEYDQGGDIVSGGLTQEAYGDKWASARVMSGAEYAGYYRDMNCAKAAAGDGVQVLNADDYKAKTFTIDVYQADGSLTKKAVKKEALLPGTRSVLVRLYKNVHSLEAAQALPMILYQAPVDLSRPNSVVSVDLLAKAGGNMCSRSDDPGTQYAVPEQMRSLVIDKRGFPIYKSQYDIGYRVAYLKDKDGNPLNPSQVLPGKGDTVIGGVPGAKVETGLQIAPTATNSSGKYVAHLWIPPCPTFSFMYNFRLYAGVRVGGFNPQNPSGTKTKTFPSVPVSHMCIGYGEGAGGSSLLGQLANLAARTISFLIGSNVAPTTHIIADVQALESQMLVRNPKVAPMPAGYPKNAYASVPHAPENVTLGGDTVYMASPSGVPAQWDHGGVANIDFNGDGKDDKWISSPKGGSGRVCLSAPSTQAYRDCVAGKANAEDLNRVNDSVPDFYDEGLVKSLSVDDLKNTDVYVFRASTGALLVHRRGLQDDEIVEPKNRSKGLAANLQVVIPGPRAISATREKELIAWQSRDDVGVTKPYQGRYIDSIRPGETVTVVAVNRVTGYVGTTKTQIEMAKGSSQTVTIGHLVMMPPNLKVQVTRAYQKPSGQEKHLVGLEGGATKSDDYVSIKTVWLDQDGSPLPNCSGDENCDLQYTGYLAVAASGSGLVGDKAYGGSKDQFTRFQIRPGAYTQVLKLKGDSQGDLATKHFYVAVGAETTFDKGFFVKSATAGAGNGSYTQPYVPVRVPVFDEAATDELRNSTLYAGEDVADTPAAYRWPYRPAMSFSIIDLVKPKMIIHRNHSDGTDCADAKYDDCKVITFDPNDTNYQHMAELLSDDATYAELVYGLNTQTDHIDPFGAAPQQYIFALGGDEQLVDASSINNTSTAQSLEFHHLDSLQHVTGTDLLALSLYLNSDPSNVLWQASLPGVYVYYEAPTPLKMVEREKDSKGDPMFRTLGGMRLMLHYLPKRGESVSSYKWSIVDSNASPVDDGRWYDSFKSEAKKVSDSKEYDSGKKSKVYWEPNSWTLYDSTKGDTFKGKLTLTLSDGSTPNPIEFEIKRRLLEPNSKNPMHGSDVSMIEAMLWHLGLSPQRKYKGKGGNRIDSERYWQGRDLGHTKNCSGKAADDRSVYYSGWSSCAKGYVSTQGLIARFQARNNHTSSSYLEGNSEDGKPGRSTLRALGRVWRHYREAYDWAAKNSIGGHLTVSNSPDKWWADASSALDGGDIPYDYPKGVAKRSIPKTYTKALHAGITNDFPAAAKPLTRKGLLKSWVYQESGNLFWGAGAPETPYRMLEGSADEWGSMGFNHVLWPKMYGRTTRCISVRGYAKPVTTKGNISEGVNMYKPKNNLLGLVAAASDDKCTSSDGLYRAFIDTAPKTTYKRVEKKPPLAVCYLDDCQNAGKNDWHKLAVDAATGYYTDDSLMLLAKGIIAYNGGTGHFHLTGGSYFSILKSKPIGKVDSRGNFTMTATHFGYWLSIKHRSRLFFDQGEISGYLPYAEYEWPGPDRNKDGHPDFCFLYGEREWRSGLIYSVVRRDAKRFNLGVNHKGDVDLRLNSCY